MLLAVRLKRRRSVVIGRSRSITFTRTIKLLYYMLPLGLNHLLYWNSKNLNSFTFASIDSQSITMFKGTIDHADLKNEMG